MKAYTAQEWQTKFKEQAGKDKQLLHDLDCTALIKANEAQKLESKLEEIFSKMHDLQVDYLDKMACDDECKRKRELDTFREQWFKLWSNDIDIVASKLTQANRTIEAANKIADEMDLVCDTHIKDLKGVRASLFRDYAKKLRASVSQEQKNPVTPDVHRSLRDVPASNVNRATAASTLKLKGQDSFSVANGEKKP